MITIPQRNLIAKFLFGRSISGEELLKLSPASFYIGLSEDELTEDGVITGELTSGGYKRAKVENTYGANNTFSESANNGVITNEYKEVRFERSTEVWPAVKSVFISPNAEPTEGEFAMYIAAVDIQEIPSGVNLYYDKGALQLSIGAGE